MQRRPLGRTGLQVSIVGFGGSPIGGAFRPVTQAAATQTVRTALARGINYFDTAPYYGATRAETVLGQALRGVPRGGYILASKVGRYTQGVDGFDFSAARVRRSVDESLGRLGCGHLDLVQVHDMEFGSLDRICTETLPALQDLRASGKIRFIGITGLPLATLRRVYERCGGLIDTVLSYCHGTLNDSTFFPFAHELRRSGAGVLNAAPLAMGLLTHEGPPAWHPAPAQLREACAAAGQVCVRRGARLSDLALSYAFGRGEVDSTIVGLASAEEVNRAAACADAPPDPELIAEVRAVLAPVQGVTWPSGRAENN